MGKTVYSLVLSSEVVQAVDSLAAQQGYSRSALVNHILAEYAKVASPQQRARDILGGVQQLADSWGLRMQASTAGSLTLRTALRYKYNPALSYTLELLAGEDEWLGRLRVSVRSQNAPLLDYFGSFFQLWQALEEKHLAQPPPAGSHAAEAKRYLRLLRQPRGAATGTEAGQAVAGYIATLDACLKTFIQNCANTAAAVQATEQEYLAGLGANPHIKHL